MDIASGAAWEEPDSIQAVSLTEQSRPAAYLGGPLSELSQHLGSVVRDDAQGVVQQGHVLQTREAADAPDLLHLQETSSLPSSLL